MQIEDNSIENVKKDGSTDGIKDGSKDRSIKENDPPSLNPQLSNHLQPPHLTNRIEINRSPIKKKKRFIYYGLSIFFSFIVARLALIAISLYSLNFDKLILNNMKYDSSNYDSFTLDVSLSDTYSPLFIRIKDIDCDVFGIKSDSNKGSNNSNNNNTNNNTTNTNFIRFFSLDVPDIEIIKYKTLRFIHDIKFKNMNPKDILESNNLKAIKVKVRGKLCYRFCLMKFYLRFDKEKIIEIKNKENKVKWPIINNLDIKKKEDSIFLNLNIDNSNFRLPYYVNITLSESLIKCTQDFPCTAKISEQKFGNGHFMTPLKIEIKIDKKDLEKIGNTIFDLINYKDVILEIESITTNKMKHELGLQRQVSIGERDGKVGRDGSKVGKGEKGNSNSIKKEDSTSMNNNSKTNPPTSPPTTNPQSPPSNTPLYKFPYSLQKLEIIDNQIFSSISMGLSWIPFISPETRINLEDFNLKADIELYDKIVGRGEVKIESNINNLDLNFKIKINDLQGIYDFKNEYQNGIVIGLNFVDIDEGGMKEDGIGIGKDNENGANDALYTTNNIHSSSHSTHTSLLKDFKLIFDKRNNLTKIFLQFKSKKIILKEFNNQNDNNDNSDFNLDHSPFYNFNHFFFSSFNSINFHSTLSSCDPQGSPLVLFKNVKPKFFIKTELGLLNLTVKFLNFRYFEKGFLGGICVIGEFKPKIENFKNFNKKKMKIEILGNEIEIDGISGRDGSKEYGSKEYGSSSREYSREHKGNNKDKNDPKTSKDNKDTNNPPPILSLDLSYSKSTSLFNHIFKLILTFNLNNWFLDYFNHFFKFPKNFIQLNIYTKGVPLKDLNTNIITYNINPKGSSLEIDLGIYLNLNVIKSLMYGEGVFFSKHNLISTLISENINNVIQKGGDLKGSGSKVGNGNLKDDNGDNREDEYDPNNNRMIIPKKIIMDLQLDSTEPKFFRNQYFNSYLGHLKIGIPKEVVNSFLIKKINNFPKINLGFYGEGMKSKGDTNLNINFESDENYKYLIVKFEINTEIFEKEGQFVIYEISNSDNRGVEGSDKGSVGMEGSKGSVNDKGNVNDKVSKDPSTKDTYIKPPTHIVQDVLINRGAITLSKNDLISFFRLFFIKIFEIPEGDYIPNKIGFFVEHGEVKKNNSEVNNNEKNNILFTKSSLFIYTKSIEDFFTKMIPSLILKSKISKLPKYFEFNLKSKRLDLLNLNLNGNSKNFLKLFVKDLECKSFFFMKYPSKIKIENIEEHLRIIRRGWDWDREDGSRVGEGEEEGRDDEGSRVGEGRVDGEDEEDDPNSHPNHDFNHDPSNSNHNHHPNSPTSLSTGKLTFNGTVFLNYNLPSLISISKISYSLPFIKFISFIMKEPSSYPPLIFFRLLPLDLAFELPFNFKVESKNNLEYEVLIDDKSVIKERLLVDQGDDKYLHLNLQKAKIENTLDLLKMENESIIRIILRQGENELMNFKFKLDKKVKDYFELNFEEALGNLSYLLQNNQYKIYDLFGIKIKVDVVG